jgi:hypothetical protein
MGNLYTKQEKFNRAYNMYARARLSFLVTLRLPSNEYERVRVNIANLSSSQDKILGGII